VLINVESERKVVTETVYSVRALEEHSCNDLYEWLNDQHVPNPIPKDKLHCSVICACSDLPPGYIPDRRQVLIYPTTYLLGTIGPAFALFFESWQLKKQWHDAVVSGVSMIYDNFVPHVSLSYSVLMDDFDYNALQPPSFEIRFREEVVSAFDPQFAKRNWQRA
jgi:hypothetical protein